MTDKKTIMVVEDESELLDLIRRKLETNGFATLGAKTVPEALEMFEQNKVDALWLDHYLLGKKNGFDLVVELKSHENIWGKVPVFVVSNTAGPEEIQSYIQLGVNKYYVKSNATLGQIIEDVKAFFDSPENASSEK
jgi:CheY-like chemotaxis protein